MTAHGPAQIEASERDGDGIEALVTAMARIGSCAWGGFSPDASRFAFVSDLSGIPQLWTVPTGGGWPERLTLLDDPVGGAEWSPRGDWIAFTVAPGGGMNVQVWMIRPDGSDRRRLTSGGTETNGLGPWTRDGRALAISSNEHSPRSMVVSLLEIDTGERRPIADTHGVGNILDFSRDGRRAVLSRVVSRGDNDLYLLDLASGAEVLLTPHEPPASFSGATFSPDGRAIYLGSNAERDLLSFARIVLSPDGQPGPIEVLASRDDAELDRFTIADDGETASLNWNVAGRSEIGFIDLHTRECRPGPVLPAEIGAPLEFSDDGRILALGASGSAAPADIWVYDLASGGPTQVTHSPHAGVDLDLLIRPDLVRFAAHDGLELSGWLYRPHGAHGPVPVVLSFHGGPEAQERPFLNATYQGLLAAGIAIFAPNVRGSSGFGKRFVNLDNGPLRVNGVKDIASCVEYVVGAGVAAPGRIGIMGGSYGGYMTMAGLTEYPELFAAGANLFGVVNFETFFEHTEPWMAAISTVEYGDPATEREMLRALSPIHKVDRVAAPTIVLHGANDTNVPVIEAEQTVDSLRRRGVPVEYVLFPDEGHGFRKAKNRVTATLAVVRWFRRYLGDDAV